jgi:hypothetical protein
VNDRRFSNEHLVTVFNKAQAMAQLMDRMGYDTFWLAEHHSQHEGYECIPNVLMYAVHPSHVTRRLRLGCGFKAVHDLVYRFMQTEVAPVMDGYEQRGEFPRELVRKAGEAGLYGAVFPESVGGTTLGYLAATVIQEEMARNDVRFAACNNQQGSTCPAASTSAARPSRSKSTCPTCWRARRSA